MAKKRQWFFQAPATKDGTRFVRNNIPTQITYSELLNSVPFFQEESDQLTETRQGLVKAHSNDTAITARNLSASPDALKLIKSSQIPGVSVKLDNGNAQEPNVQDENNDGVPVKGSGIKITSRIFSAMGTKRTTFQTEIDIDSLQVTNLDLSNFYMVVYNPSDGKHYKVKVTDLLSTNGGRDTVNYTYSQNTLAPVWTFEHPLPYIPAVSIEVDGVAGMVEADIQHSGPNTNGKYEVTITFNDSYTGKAYLT